MTAPRRPKARRKPATPLAVTLPSLLLFGLVLLGVAGAFAGSFAPPARAGRWIGTSVALLLSTAVVLVLLREVVRRLDELAAQGRRSATARDATTKDATTRPWRFTPRWKEELLCTSPDGQLVLEMMIIEPHVYFPTEEAWARRAPEWAKDRRAELLLALERWCEEDGVSLTVDDKAWVAAAG